MELADITPLHPQGQLLLQSSRPAPSTTNMPFSQESDADSSEPEDGLTAYERIKRQLMVDQHDSPNKQDAMQSSVLPAASTDMSESEDLPSTKRMRPTHRLRDTSRPVSSQQHRSSPASGSEQQRWDVKTAEDQESVLAGQSSDSESPSTPQPSSRLQDLVKQRRAEREAKEAAARHNLSGEDSISSTKPSKAKQNSKRKARIVVAESESDGDKETASKFTQQARPTRKASKKAIEDMNRETQRIARSMQLAHQARTRTKFEQKDFFAKFNFDLHKPGVQSSETNTSNSLPATSDAEPAVDKDTPPSSPPCNISQSSVTKKALTDDTINPVPIIEADSEDDDTQSFERVLHDLRARAKEDGTSHAMPTGDSLPKTVPQLGAALKRPSIRQLEKKANRYSSEADDGLEIVQNPRSSRFKVLDNVTASRVQESRPLHTLRALAHLNDHEFTRTRAKQSMSRSELNSFLQHKSRKQAQVERHEKIQKLREKGILIQTPEEKEREQLQIDDILEKAREQDEQLAKTEKEAARKDGTNDDGILDSDDDEEWEADKEDEDDEGDDEEEKEDSELELSGSEDEETISSKDHDHAENEDQRDPEPADDSEHANEDNEPRKHARNIDQGHSTLLSRRSSKRVVVSDDEEEEEEEEEDVVRPSSNVAATLKPKPIETPSKATTMAAFGFNKAQITPGDLSQMFAGTMADSQTQGLPTYNTDQQDSMLFMPGMSPIFHAESPTLTRVSQRRKEMLDNTDDVQVEPATPVVPLNQTGTQITELPEATQDVGFQVFDSQLNDHTEVQSSVDTVALPSSIAVLSSQPRPRLRLQRRMDVEVLGPTSEDGGDSDAEHTQNAFIVMKQASKQKLAPLDFVKKTSNAKGMVEEQAEESEDEYAGLGGASDEDTGDELDEETRQMINDDSNEKLNERELASFYAGRARAENEKGIAKLYQDVVHGGLRRKRDADMALFDSDDEDEAAARRRAAKQREFAKMRRALLTDEKLGKIAENPKQQAFLQSVEDRAEEDDFSILDETAEIISQIPDSQGHSAPLATVSENVRKREREDYEQDMPASQVENQPNQKIARRSRGFTKPTSLLDIRNTLSEIIGEPESLAEEAYMSSTNGDAEAQQEEDDEYEDDRNFIDDADDPVIELLEKTKNPRRTGLDASRTAVVDRMALKRQQSSSRNSMNTSTDGRLAFQATGAGENAGFRLPSLLRRATNASTASEGNERGVTSAAAMHGKAVVKMGGTKKSSVNSYVREQERKARLDKVAHERMEDRARIGKMRRERSGLRALVGGNFN